MYTSFVVPLVLFANIFIVLLNDYLVGETFTEAFISLSGFLQYGIDSLPINVET